MLPRLVLTFALTLAFPSVRAAAQATAPAQPTPQAAAQFDAPAYVAVVDGSATLERDGRVESSPLNMPLLSGDRLRTTTGRVEVRYADGGRLLIDSNTAVDVLSDGLVRLGDGRIRLHIVHAASQQVSYRVDSIAGSARMVQAGDYRVALLHGPATSTGAAAETQLEFAVISGEGEIATDQGVTAVRAGEHAYASAGLLPSYAYSYNSANGDDFDHWTDMQHDTVYAATGPSAQYLPSDMANYSSTFDQYGDWRYQQSYGYVWYPHVASDWHPYYYGRWSSYPTYGWTWITADPFGYPTHHYGRWGFSAGLWFWIPSAYWGPAYVSWAYAPNYVSWCPLAYNNTAVFSIGFYNVGPAYYASHYHGHYYSAWTTVAYGSFGHGYAHQHAVSWDHGNGVSRPHFTEGRAPAGSYAVARASVAAPVRYAGTRPANGAAPIAARSSQTRFSATRGTAPARSAIAQSAPVTDPRSGRTDLSRAPRYVNRGTEIIRSQTAQPIAPRDTSVARTAPVQAQRGYAWDNPSYRPPNYNPPASYGAVRVPDAARAYGRTMPRQEIQQARPQQAQPQYAPAYPSQQPGAYQRPPAAEYARPSGGNARLAPSTGGGEHAAPRAAAPSGGHVETHAPSGAGVAHSRGRGR